MFRGKCGNAAIGGKGNGICARESMVILLGRDL